MTKLSHTFKAMLELYSNMMCILSGEGECDEHKGA